MAENSGPEEAIKRVVEDAKGKAKEAVGTVTGRDDLVREGKAQQASMRALLIPSSIAAMISSK